ncbi:MAG: VCBS repeat-containing protein [Deltaproteobacteria bacterium]|nr:VCBS repeat-containing protein [Deltaproteobacteria bacterium]
MVRILVLVLGVVVVATPGIARGQSWTDATGQCIGTTAQWSNKVELADVDKDGLVDLLIANGGNYNAPGTAEPVRIWKNLGGWGTVGTHCQEISATAVLGFTGLSRVVKAIDVDRDGDLDIITGGAYQSQLKLFLRGATAWTDGSAQLPQQLTSIGDLEAGDVDGDGDLDLLLAEWGTGNPQTNAGGRTRLYLNNAGTFTDATAANMPAQLVRWSWDVELADVDNDWDLDALIACKSCTTSYLFRNDGTGKFTDDPNALPHFANNYDFEPMDLDNDGDLDLATINDGAQFREHIFINDGTGKFNDESAQRLFGTANPAGADDNVAVWLDADYDGDADLLVGSLGDDRLLINASGIFTLSANATPNDTGATLGLAAADLDGDGRLDLLQGQGEIAFPDKVQLGAPTNPVDDVAPACTVEKIFNRGSGKVRARVHDHQSPSRLHDYQRVWIEYDGPAPTPLHFESPPPPDTSADMTWYGEYLWISPELPSFTHYRVCATDRKGNQGCSMTHSIFDSPDGANLTEHGDTIDAGTGTTGKGAGCCDTGSSPRGAALLVAIVLLGLRRRRRAS